VHYLQTLNHLMLNYGNRWDSLAKDWSVEIGPWFTLSCSDKMLLWSAFMERESFPLRLNDRFAPDLLRGGAAIADFLFDDPEQRRKVYHLAKTSRLPVFRLGSLLCARKSTLLEWVARQERRDATPWNSSAAEIVRRV
jgi:hypothetical protein